MRQLTLTTILFLFVCIGTLSLEAQVTITKDNFPRETNFTDHLYVKSGVEVIVPSEGPYQIWDYSGIEGATLTEQVFQDASNDADFPEALNYRRRDTDFQQFTIPYDAYEKLDETGYYPVGFKYVDTSFPLTAISGGADDVLRFPPSVVSPDGNNYYVQFPLEYQKQWENTFSGLVNFELTIAAFGLNQTPGFNKRTSNVTREVVGYGELVIPLEDGSPSNAVEALMVKSSFTHVDSFFVGGAPAPAALLNAFGIVQGETSEGLSYSFFTPGSGAIILLVNVGENEYNYRPKALLPQPTVIITKDNFPRGGSFTDLGYFADTNNMEAPSEGVNQVWDYSFLTPDSLVTQVHTDASNDPVFPDALNYIDNTINFNEFPVNGIQYEAIDEDGWYQQGRITEEVSYSITAISGGADDILRFPDREVPYGGRLNKLDFPVMYGKDWTQSQIENTEFELSVAAFGLNGVPGVNVRTVTENRSVVGEGKLIMPSEDGSPGLPMDVLLLKAEQTVMDSIFLGGAPAPAALLAAFGLTQGATTTAAPRYIFYTPDFASNVLNVNPASGTFFYRPQAATSATPNFILNREDFTREAGFTDIAIRAALESATLPTEGANQVWDYTALSAEATITKEYTDAINHPDFPNALNITPDNGQTFQGLPIPTNFVETVDEEGWGYIGKVVTDITHSISALTGGADDVLRFIGGNFLYDGRINRIQFPLTDLSEWTESRTELIDFELTVGVFGLNQVPGHIERTHTHTHEAMGYGTLQIPLEDGTPSEPMEVVLLKVEQTSIDYYYLGGALAPEALTNAFGLTQGTQLLNSQTYYTFYTPGFHINVMRFNVNPETGEMANVFYRPQAAKQVAPIAINHNRVCDVPSVGQSQVTVLITGGEGPYQVSGNFNGEIEEGEPFIFIMSDNESSYEISVVDAEGNESQVFENVLPCTKLPVELLDFEGKTRNDGNLLQWTTASELNNHFFTLSYSTTGQNFIPIQRITGNGTTSSANSYEFLHEDAPSGFVYYQLSQTDLDGTNKDLKVIGLNRKEFGISSIEVSPVPTKSQLNISFDFANTSKTVNLNIYDSMGRIVKSQTLSDASTSIQLDVNNLPEGTYLLQLNNGLEALTSKFVKF